MSDSGLDVKRELDSELGPLNAPRVLVVGHSHVLCIKRHLEHARRLDAQVLHLNTVLDAHGNFSALDDLRAELEPALVRGPPAAVCVCVAGSLHNRLGTIEHPRPFGLHDPDGGTTATCDRWPIPWAVMRHSMEYLLAGWLQMADAIYAQFSGAARFYLNPPPPILNWAHIHRFPGQFKKVLHMGPAPSALRLQLYRLQTSSLRNYAQRKNATFVDPPPDAIDAQGFLTPECWSHDPTHGNRRYGMLAFRHLEQQLENAT